VTQSEYTEVMQGLRDFKDRSAFKGPDNPVENVEWRMAKLFCQRLTSRAQEKSAGRQYRLPTEAEWEYACRAGTTSTYSFGDDASRLGQYAWYDENAWDVGEQHAHRVRQKLRNPWGLYDMHGNVFEWCRDWHSPYGSELVGEPGGPVTGEHGVLRGGSFDVGSAACRSAFRHPWQRDLRNRSSGFRVSRTYN